MSANLKPGSMVLRTDLDILEEKIMRAIFGNYERVEDRLIYMGGANRRMFRNGKLRGFDVPVVIGLKQDGSAVVQRFRFFEQDPRKKSSMATRARKGEQIMWVIDMDEEKDFVAYWDSEGRHDIKEERLRRDAKQSPQTTTTKVLR